MDGYAQYTTAFLSRAMALLPKGPRCTFISNITAYSSGTLVPSCGGPSIKREECQQFHPNNTSSEEWRNSRETAIPLSSHPRPRSLTKMCSFHEFQDSCLKKWRKSSRFQSFSGGEYLTVLKTDFPSLSDKPHRETALSARPACCPSCIRVT